MTSEKSIKVLRLLDELELEMRRVNREAIARLDAMLVTIREMKDDEDKR